MARRVLILGAGVGSGHNQAASAIEAAVAELPEAGQVDRIDILETTNDVFQRLYDDAYFALVAEVPWLVGWGYDSQDLPFGQAPVVQWFEQLNTTAIVRAIRDDNPDVVICTHFLPARLVSLLIARGQLQASLTVVATDYDFQGLWLTSPFSHFFVARDETAAQLAALGLPPDRVSVSGIPVVAALGAPAEPAARRHQLGLHPALPIVLISAGASGGSYTLNIVRQVLGCEQNFQAVVVCGRNVELRAEVNKLAEARPERFRVLGYTSEMPDLMRLASLFVGKPGGLSSSECMAAGLPMVIVNPIPGQEERNADFLLESGAAVRCNYPMTVGFKIDTLLGEPDRIRAMAAAARRIGHPEAARTVAELSLQQRQRPLWITRQAQRSMQLASKDGVGVADLPRQHQLRTLTDPATGASLAVATGSQLEPLGAIPTSRSLVLSRPAVRALQWQSELADIASAGNWLLADATTREFGLV